MLHMQAWNGPGDKAILAKFQLLSLSHATLLQFFMGKGVDDERWKGSDIADLCDNI